MWCVQEEDVDHKGMIKKELTKAFGPNTTLVCSLLSKFILIGFVLGLELIENEFGLTVVLFDIV